MRRSNMTSFFFEYGAMNMLSKQKSLRGICLTFAAVLFLMLGQSTALAANPCIHEDDGPKRLACYDKLFSEKPDTAVHKEDVPATTKMVTAKAQVSPDDEPISSSSNLSRFWELDDDSRGEAFVVKTYQPNFLLPFHYSSGINHTPRTPTQPATTKYENSRNYEAKLQISLRAKIADDLIIPGSNLWFAYTQRSLWQIWNHADSAPFRSTDYIPEAIYNVPVSRKFGALPYGWQLRLLQAGIAHQSNGQSDPLSRSWNYVYGGVGFEKKNLSVIYRYRHRLKESYENDDNPDLVDYIGRNELALNWFAGRSTWSLTWKTNFSDLSRGSTQFDFTYPVFANNPNGLRWYFQLFSGYGETMLDYNHRQDRIGAGLTLFQF